MMNKSELKHLFTQLHFSPKKHFGQNFLTDPTLLRKIVKLSTLKKEDVVVEVGTGFGTLTDQLIGRVEKVYTYEIDPLLFEYVSKKYENVSNIEIFNNDILQAEIPPCNKVISNPPYSITGVLLEKLFFHPNPPNGILIIEEKLAKRIFTQHEYKTYSRISVTVNSFMEPIFINKVPPSTFYPRPKIPLSLIKLIPKASIHPFLQISETRQFFLKIIAGIMPYKNKHLKNALELCIKNQFSESFNQMERIERYLRDQNISTKKVFQIPIHQFPIIAENIYQLTNSVQK